MSVEESFWGLFANEFWGKKPGLFEGVLKTPMFETGQLVEVTDQMISSTLEFACGSGHNDQVFGAPPLRLFVKNRLLEYPEFIAFRPSQKDLDLESYMDEMKAKHGDFAVILGDLEKYSPDVRRRFREVLARLIPLVGVPGRGWNVDAFFGAYRATPFGVHRDIGCGVLSFMAYGRKTFLLWPPDYFAQLGSQRPFSEPEIESYAADARRFDAETGNLVYWPADWWHVAYDPEGRPSASVNIGVWQEVSVSALIARVVELRLREALGAADLFKGCWLDQSSVPAEIRRALEAFRLVDSAEVEALVEAMWKDRIGLKRFE